MTKKTKKPVFGQLTLTGELALDWMKNETEINCAKIDIGPIGAFGDYNVPEWAHEKSGDIALLYTANKWDNPVLVTQRSILRALEEFCVEKETQGATTTVEKAHGCHFGRLDLNDNPVKLRFVRDTKKGKFSPYQMEVL